MVETIKKLDSAFDNATEQYYELFQTLFNHFKKDVADEITAFVHLTTEAKLEDIKRIVNNRTQLIKELTTNNDPKMNRQMRVARFIEKTKPDELARDIQEILSLDHLFAEHQRFIQTMATRDLGESILQFQLDQQLIQYIKAGVYSVADDCKVALEQYAQAIKEFAMILNNAKKSAGDKAFIKLGASILGGLTGGIFGSMAAKEITSAFLSDEQRIIQAINRIFAKWEVVIETYSQIIEAYRQRYRLVTLTLFGGTLLQFSEQLQKNGIYIEQLSLVEFHYILSYNEENLQHIQQWAVKSLDEIKQWLVEENIEEALKASDRFYHAVQNNSLMRSVSFDENYSLIYLANMYKYAALTNHANQLKKHDEIAFLNLISEIYKQMPYIIHDRDLRAIGCLEQTDILLNWIHLCIKKEYISNLTSLLDYGLKLLTRSNEGIFYLGESKTFIKDAIDIEMILLLLAIYMDSDHQIKHPLLEQLIKFYHLEFAQVAKLRKRYAIYGKQDSFYRYLAKVILSIISVFPLRLITAPLRWLRRRRSNHAT